MPRGRPRSLSLYEKTKSRNIRKFLSDMNISRFDGLHDSDLLNTVKISDGKVFVSLDYHTTMFDKIGRYIETVRNE